MRLDKILANSGIGSRTEVKQIIKDGRISVAGSVLRDSALKIKDEEISLIQLDGHPLDARRNLYYVLNKPAGYITAMEDRNTPTVADLMPDFFANKRVAPVGRLDKDTTGLLIFTNDGELHHRLLSPKYEIERTYLVETSPASPSFAPSDIDRVAAGISIDEGERCKPAILRILDTHSCQLVLTEGKFHEVKRIIKALDKELISLHREQYANLRIDALPIGSWRELSDEEIEQAKELCGL